jgi:UDP-N-acetylglucosamine 2-epimerase (non-hydrolysing)
MSIALNGIHVTTILGTRPEIIRLSEIIKKLDRSTRHRLIFTSKNREGYVGQDFFEELGIRTPNAVFTNTSNSTSEYLAHVFIEIERELIENRPHAVVILGDTNTALTAIIARKMGIPVYHLEAGNRSFDSNVPEEVNRKIVDHISDFNLAYSRKAEQNLLREGLSPRASMVMGTPLNEVIRVNSEKIRKSDALNRLGLTSRKYFLVSAHRQENIDNEDRLGLLIRTLNEIAEEYQIPVIVTTHPRLKSKLAQGNFKTHPEVKLMQPLGFVDYCNLQTNARIVLSDSGSVSEESALLNFKAITIRDSMERPEALEVGTVLMSGLNPEIVKEAIKYLETSDTKRNIPEDYAIQDSSDRVLNFLFSTHHLRDFWSGIR